MDAMPKPSAFPDIASSGTRDANDPGSLPVVKKHGASRSMVKIPAHLARSMAGNAESSPSLSRRSALALTFGAALSIRLVTPARATTETMAAAMREALGTAEIRTGRVKLEIPPLVENGNAVPLSIAVESPMTADDHVTTIFVFSEVNPQPNVCRFHLSPRAGKAHVRTTIRLAGTQNIVAVARMKDGSLWSGSGEAIVTEAACLDGT